MARRSSTRKRTKAPIKATPSKPSKSTNEEEEEDDHSTSSSEVDGVEEMEEMEEINDIAEMEKMVAQMEAMDDDDNDDEDDDGEDDDEENNGDHDDANNDEDEDGEDVVTNGAHGNDESEGSGSGSERDNDNEGDDDDSNDSHSNPATTFKPSASKAFTHSGSSNDANDGQQYEELCTFDLSNLLAFNTHQINSALLYSSNAKTTTNATNTTNKEWYQHATISAEDGTKGSKGILPHPVNEAMLLQKAAEGTAQLLRELWKLPSDKTEVGRMARLPKGGEMKLPRALPPPPPKQLTKWEQFALQRGIAPKSKQSRKVLDEATGEWKFLTGSLRDKANAGPESWPILEVKKNDDPYADPWEALRQQKKERVAQNVESRMRNAERRGDLEKGSANRMKKEEKKVKARREQREEEMRRDKERGIVAPVGIPIDARSNGKEGVKRGKPSTQLALRATQVSTASLGKFDKMREGEPERQLSKKNSKKRKADGLGGMAGNTDKAYMQAESKTSQDILARVMNGSKEKERDVRKGKFAKGETAYDYDFDDGLGAGEFRKKKGRAGMGKMRKVTKKRIK